MSGSEDWTALERAEDAVAEAIIRAAEDAAPESLERLGNAIGSMKFGPQGGALSSATDYRYRSEVHNVAHEGERRAKPTGFVDGS